MHPPSMIVQKGFVLTIIADALSNGAVTRLSDSAGGVSFAPVQVPSSTTLVLGPFSRTRRYAIVSTGGELSVVVAESDFPLGAVADTSAATAVAFPAGGVGAAAGGWDTAANRDLAIARFTALLADVAAMRTTLNTVLARLRLSGDIT